MLAVVQRGTKVVTVMLCQGSLALTSTETCKQGSAPGLVVTGSNLLQETGLGGLKF